MPDLSQSRVGRAALATSTAGAALAIKVLTGPSVMPSVFLSFYGAVIVSAWLGGFECGVIATGLAALASLAFFLPPLWPLSTDTALTLARVMLFSLSAAAISAIVAARRQTLRDLAARVAQHTAEVERTNANLAAKVAEAQRGADALREERNFVSTLVDTVGATVIVLDPEGRVVRCNHACEMLTGYRFDEIAGRPFWEMLPPTDVGPARALFAKQLVGAWPEKYDAHWVSRDGRRHFMACATSLIKYGDTVAFVVATGIDITERYEAETQRRQSEERYALAVAGARDGLWDWNLQTNTFYFSPRCKSLLDCDGLEEGPDLSDLNARIHPDDRTQVFADLEAHIGGRTAYYQNEHRFYRRDGSCRWLLARGLLVRDEHGTPSRMAGSLTDITEQKQAQAAVRRSADNFRILAETVSAATFIFQGNDLRYVNPTAEAITGYGRDELLAMSFWDVIHPEFRDLVRSRGLARQRGEALPARYEVKILTKHGEERWVEFTGAIIEYDGQPAVLGTAFDITARKHADTVLQRAHEELEARVSQRTLELSDANQRLREEVEQRREAQVAQQESDRRFQAIFDQAAVGVSLSSADRWVVVNQKLCEILGYTRDELLQRNFIDVTHPDDLETTRTELQRLITNQVQTFTTEKRYIRKDGSPVWVSVTASALRLPSGEPQYGIAIVSDITERKRTEDALRRSEELNRRILDGVPGAIVHVSLEGQALQANAIARQILELEDNLENGHVSNFVHRVINERGVELALADFPVSKCLATGEPQGPVTVGVRRADGGVAWMILSALPIADLLSGELRSAVVTFVDITKRKQAEEELEELSIRYRNLLESVTDGFFALDHFGRFTYVNPKAEQLLQRPRGELIGTPVWEQFPDGVDSAFHKEYLHVMAERVPRVTEAYYPQLNRWFKSRAYPSQDGMSVLFEDITEQHAREITVMSDILHALNARFNVSDAFSEVAAGLRTLTGCDRSSVTLFDEDYEWGILLALEQPEEGVHPGARLRLSELPAANDVLLGRPHLVRDIESYLDSPLVQRVYAAGFRSLLSLPLRNTHRVSGMLTLTWRVTDGANITHVPLLNQIADAIAMAVDKSRLFEEVRNGREQLEALSHRLLEVQETERRHIARELHDEIGQGLTGLKLVLDAVGRLPTDSSHARLAEVHKLVNDLLTRVRNLSLDLRPGMLDDLGLLPALLWLFGRYTSQTKVRVAFEHSGLDQRFSPEIETAAYRIVQEALTNVARHAGVSEVTVRAWADATAVTVQVIDAGAGFDPDGALHSGTTGGVTGMRERTLLLGGQLTIESASGNGTRLSAELPLPGRIDGDEHAYHHPASR